MAMRQHGSVIMKLASVVAGSRELVSLKPLDLVLPTLGRAKESGEGCVV